MGGMAYRLFFFHLAQRARCAAAILRRAAAERVRRPRRAVRVGFPFSSGAPAMLGQSVHVVVQVRG
jgi:hypothetical protein